MSGIEVAGITLAIFPVIVQGVELYARGVRTIGRWWRFSKIVDRLLLRIKLEQLKFENNCRAVLCWITKPGQLNGLLKDPGGQEWTLPDLQRRLEKQLGNSYHAYMQAVVEIKETLETLRNRLEVDQSGKLKWPDAHIYRREWKRIQITLADNANHALLEQLRGYNDDLEALSGHRTRMLAIRASSPGSTAPTYQIQRAQANSLYTALFSHFARGCGCSIAHRASMCLSRNRISLRPDCQTSEHEIDKHSHFGMLFSLHAVNSPAHTASPWVQGWRETRVENIELSRGDPTTSCDLRAHDRPATPPHTPSRSLSPVDAAIAAGTASTRELCVVLKTNMASSDDLITLQGDQNWRHRVSLYDRFGLSSSAATVSLREALVQGLERKVRLALAVKLASAVLQFQTTSWMSQTWSSSEIYLLQPGQSQTQAGHAFVSVTFSEQGSKKASKAPIRPSIFPIETRNPSIFALGITLIELWYGKTLASLRPKLDGTAMSAGEILVAAKSVSFEIYRDAGDYYGDAVRRCIYCDFDQRHTGLEHAGMIDAVHRGVCEPLEKNFYAFCGEQKLDDLLD